MKIFKTFPTRLEEFIVFLSSLSHLEKINLYAYEILIITTKEQYLLL